MGQPQLASRVATRGQVEAAARRHRAGNRPEWARILTPAERLTVAAMDLLRRDPQAGDRLRSLNDVFPECIGRPGVGRSLVAHAVWHRSCLEWTASLVEIGYDIGCPSLDMLLSQLEHIHAWPAYPPGSAVSHRLTVAVTRPPRSRRGVIDNPARLLLTRRWLREGTDRGVTVREVADLWLDLVQSWVDDELPERHDITYPAWREWIGHRRSRSLMLLPPDERQREFEAWSRGGPRALDAGADIAQALAKAHAMVEDVLRRNLPDLRLRRGSDSP